MKANNILETIGNTPHVRINRLFGSTHEVWMKQERANPAASIKDRIALSMVEDAERRGLLKKDSVIVEPTPRALGMKGAIARAQELVNTTPGAWMPQQFENEANTEIHRRTTAQEILRDFPEGLDAIITGVGTGGHITPWCEMLKPKFPKLRVFAVEPSKSPVISGGQPSPHAIQGLGAGFIPKILKKELLDGVILVENEAAMDMARRCAREEGIFVGISSGAALAAVAQKLPELPKGSRVLTFCYDTGERYLSVEGLF